MTGLTRTLVLLACLPVSPGCAPQGERTITAEEMKAHVAQLSDDALRGREAGDTGIAIAEDYVAAEFLRMGLSPLPGTDSMFRPVTLYRPAFDEQATSIAFGAAGKEVFGSLGVDMRPFPFSDEGALTAPVVFAGYGITAPEHEYDDYDGIDAAGHWVLVFRHEPGEEDPESPFDGVESSRHASFANKVRNAKEHGARGMLLVTDPLHHPVGDDLRASGRLRLEKTEEESDRDGRARAGDERSEPFLAIQLSRPFAGVMVDTSGRSLTEIQTSLDAGIPASTVKLGDPQVTASVVSLEAAEQVAARNVVGFIEGSDPNLKAEWLVVGAHHDHVGAYGSNNTGENAVDTIYNGADDNASGVSGVLELAQAFASRKIRTRRSLAFATFTAEEKGLLGSKAFVDDPALPVERVRFMFNLDMIGRNPERKIEIFGDGYVRGLRDLVEQSNQDELALEFAGASYAGNSDHDSFYKKDIPFMFFFTGLHDDYHGLGDHADKLSYPRMQSLVRVAYRVLDAVDRLDVTPSFVHHVNWLGLQVELTGEGDQRKVEVTQVDTDSRAEQAGFQQGDVLIALGDEVLADPRNLGDAFRSIDPGSQRAVAVRRSGESLSIDIERARTGYMGVVPGAVDEELRAKLKIPETEGLLLRQVVADGPCDKAGLQDGDIVLRLSGQPLTTLNLASRLSQIGAGETVVLLILRDGERLEVPVTLGDRTRRR